MSQDPGSGTGQTIPVTPTGVGEKKKGGCLKWLGIGCGVLIVLLIIIFVIGYTQRDRLKGLLLDFGKGKIREVVMQTLPAEYSAAEAEQIITAFWDSIKEGSLSEEEGQKLGSMFQNAFQDGELSEEESRELLEFMKEAAGLEDETSTPDDPYSYEGEAGETETQEDTAATAEI